MKKTVFHEHQLSQLMLGTVQFGTQYGIANKTGQPPYKKVLQMLAVAAAHGVNCLDTAAGYGASENIIGRALRELRLAGQITVVTKTPHLDDNLKPAEAERLIHRGVEASLKNLRLDFLPICLIHKESNAVFAESLLRLKAKGLVRHVGISVSTPSGALNAIRSGYFEALQIPTSILDRRYLKSGVFQEAQRMKIALFVRSIYLQGLLFLPEPEVPPELAAVINARRSLEQLAARARLNLAELAIRFVLGLKGVTCLVIGLETLSQLRNNLRIFAQGPLNARLQRAILNRDPQLPENVVFPFLWPRH